MFTLALFVAATLTHQSVQARPTVRVLLVGLGPYADHKNLQLISLHGAHDCQQISKGLEDFFKIDAKASIRQLTDANATTEAIKSEFHNWLIKDAQPNDRLVFFYSGHGTVAMDGAGHPCSAIIPIDARRLPPKGGNEQGSFDPTLLITRDFFNTELAELKRESKRSNITLIFDSCDSGLAARGVAVPKGAPNPGIQMPTAGAGVPEDTDLDLGDAVLIGGAKLGSQAFENYQTQTGNLTLAILRSLADRAVSDDPNSALSFQDLKDRTLVNMADLLKSSPQVPVFAGDLTRPVFGIGKVQTQPYFLVTHRPQEAQAVLRAGSIYGLSDGCKVVILDPNTHDPKAAGIPATLSKVTEYDSELVLPPGTDIKSLFGRHARITDWAPDARTSLDISEIESNPSKDLLLKDVASSNTVSLSKQSAEVHLSAPNETAKGASGFDHEGGKWLLFDQAHHALLNGSIDASKDLSEVAAWLDMRMRDYGRRKAVEKLQAPDAWVKVSMEIVPVHTSQVGKYEVIEKLLTPPVDVRTISPGPGDRLAFRIKATYSDGTVEKGSGEEALTNSPYISVLDLTPNGAVKAAWPLTSALSPDRQRLPLDGKWHYLGATGFAEEASLRSIAAWKFDCKDGIGLEYFKLLATDEPLDLGPLLTASKGDFRGSHSQLGRILAAYRDGTLIARGDTVTPEASRFGVNQVTLVIKG